MLASLVAEGFHRRTRCSPILKKLKTMVDTPLAARNGGSLKRILQKLNDPEKEELNNDLDKFAVLADLSVEVAKKWPKIPSQRAMMPAAEDDPATILLLLVSMTPSQSTSSP
jgi:hypothetical protein